MACDQPPGRPEQELLVEVRGRNTGLVQQGMPDGGGLFALLPEFRPVAGNGRIQFYFSFIQQMPDSRRGKTFGNRKDNERGIGGDAA